MLHYKCVPSRHTLSPEMLWPQQSSCFLFKKKNDQTRGWGQHILRETASCRASPRFTVNKYSRNRASVNCQCIDYNHLQVQTGKYRKAVRWEIWGLICFSLQFSLVVCFRFSWLPAAWNHSWIWVFPVNLHNFSVITVLLWVSPGNCAPIQMRTRPFIVLRCQKGEKEKSAECFTIRNSSWAKLL